MKRFFSSFIISYFPLIIFLATVLYGCLKIDFGDISQHDPYGWYFVIFLAFPVIINYGMTLLFNLIKGIVIFSTEESPTIKAISLLYSVVTLLIVCSLCYSPEIIFGLYVFSDIGKLVWKMVFSLSILSLPLLDWLIKQQQKQDCAIMEYRDDQEEKSWKH